MTGGRVALAAGCLLCGGLHAGWAARYRAYWPTWIVALWIGLAVAWALFALSIVAGAT